MCLTQVCLEVLLCGDDISPHALEPGHSLIPLRPGYTGSTHRHTQSLTSAPPRLSQGLARQRESLAGYLPQH